MTTAAALDRRFARGLVSGAEDWHPVVRGRFGVVSDLKRAERGIERVFRRRFAHQMRDALPRLIAMLPSLLPVELLTPEPIAAADPPKVPRSIQEIVNLALDTSVDSDDLAFVLRNETTAARSGFQSTLTRIGVPAAERSQFTLVARSSTDWLRAHTNEMFRSVDATTKKRIGRSLARGLRAGEHLDVLTQRVTKTLGEGGWRARLIAQTETINAHARAAEETAASVGVERMQWLDGQPGACPICLDLHGTVKELPDGDYIGKEHTRRAPPAHPACRCAQIPYITEDDAVIAQVGDSPDPPPEDPLFNIVIEE